MGMSEEDCRGLSASRRVAKEARRTRLFHEDRRLLRECDPLHIGLSSFTKLNTSFTVPECHIDCAFLFRQVPPRAFQNMPDAFLYTSPIQSHNSRRFPLHITTPDARDCRHEVRRDDQSLEFIGNVVAVTTFAPPVRLIPFQKLATASIITADPTERPKQNVKQQ